MTNQFGKQYSSNNGIRIIGVGGKVPSHAITNDDLTKLVDTSDEWVTSRTGIKTRYVVSGDEGLMDIALPAVKTALASAGMKDGSEIDLIIVASSSSEIIYPAVAPQIQAAIGATRACGFDISLACSGFMHAFITAYQYLKAGTCKKALVVGADIHSRLMDWSDRNICVLFGDGAGAIILEAEENAKDSILTFNLGLDGSRGMDLTCFTGNPNCPLVESRSDVFPFLAMNGREVFKFTMGTVPQTIEKALETANLNLDDIDQFVLHQANIRIMQGVSERMGIPPEKMLIHVDKVGNTSSASIPLALNYAVEENLLQPGQRILLCGFGAGMAWATSILDWTLVDQRKNTMANNGESKPLCNI